MFESFEERQRRGGTTRTQVRPPSGQQQQQQQPATTRPTTQPPERGFRTFRERQQAGGTTRATTVPDRPFVTPKEFIQQQGLPTWPQFPFPSAANPAHPVHPEERGPYELPPSWDYQTASTGPDGEPTPFGALGWTPQGTPWYGDGMGGWWRGVTSRWSAPVDLERERKEISVDFTSWSSALSTITEGAKELSARAENVPGSTILSKVGRGATEVVRAVGKLFELPARVTEQYYGGLAIALEEGATGSNIEALPELPSAQELEVDIFGSNLKVGKFIELVRDMNPIRVGWNAVRTLENWDNYGPDKFEENFEAGRVAYSVFNDQALRREFVNRARSGENVELLEMELADPGLTFFGEFIFDPLNLVAAIAKKKGWSTTRRATTARKYYKATGPAADLITAARKVGSLDDLASSKLWTELAEASQKSFKGASTQLTDYATSTGLNVLIATGKRAGLARRTSNLLSHISQSTDNVDEVLDILVGLAARGSDDLDEVASGMNTLLRQKNPELLFSAASDDLGVVIRNTITNADGVADHVGFLDDLAKAVEKGAGSVAELVGKKTIRAIDDMFPTLTQQIDAAKFAKEGLSNADIAKAVKVLPKNVDNIVQMGQDIGVGRRSLARLDRVAQSNLVRPLNTLFANVYMGLNPGFAFRNLLSNTTHVWTDFGPRTGLQALAGGISEVFRPNRYFEKVFDDITSWTGGDFPAWLNKVRSPASAGNLGKVPFDFFLKKSEGIERVHGAVVYAKAYGDQMRRAIKRFDVTSLVDAGLGEDTIRAITTRLIDNHGSVDDVVDFFRKANTSGFADAFRTSEWIEPSDLKFLQDLRIDTEIMDVVRAGETAEDVNGALQKIRNGVMEKANQLEGEIPGLTTDLEEGRQFLGYKDAGTVNNAVLDGDITGVKGAIYNARSTANTEAVREWKRTVESFSDVVRSRIGQDAPELAEAVTSISNKWRTILDELETSQGALRQKFRNGTRAISDEAVRLKRSGKGRTEDWIRLWKEAGIKGEPPSTLGFREMKDVLWDNHYVETVAEAWAKSRDQIAVISKGIMEEMSTVTGQVIDPADFAAAENALAQAHKFDGTVLVEGAFGQRFVALSPGSKQNFDAIVKMANANKIRTATKTGVPINKALLGIIAKHGGDVGRTFENIYDVPFEVAEASIKAWKKSRNSPFTKTVSVDDLVDYLDLKKTLGIDDVTRVGTDIVEEAVEEGAEAVSRRISGIAEDAQDLMPPYDGNTPSFARMLHEQREGIGGLFDRLNKGVSDNFGATRPIAFSKSQDEAFSAWSLGAKENISEARLLASGVADQLTDFTMLNYSQKKGIDTALSYIFPYQFWHRNTYANWLKRITQPENWSTIANYAKYRTALETAHAGAPEWWKYNVNTNELFGRDDDNPLFFNLEASLNPINSLTGTDFNIHERTTTQVLDPKTNKLVEQRLGWWTTMLDDLDKLGPSTWTPFQIATAYALKLQGNDEAAAAWGSRLIPQTSTLKSLMALTNTSVAGQQELDPSVWMFSNGMDRWERNRVGRALAQMVQDGAISQEVAEDSAFAQSGEAWEQAVLRSRQDRGLGQVFSTLLGVGFKARKEEDVKIDQFYEDYRRLWNMRPNLAPAEFREAMDEMRNVYSFMETVLLSRRDSPSRDTGMGYNVLNRVPPGQSSQIYEWAGIDDRLVERFFNDKGNMQGWAAQDRDRFMAGVVDIAAVLAIPDSATKSEWTTAKNELDNVSTSAKEFWGDDIIDRADTYFGALEDRGLADSILSNDPAIGQYLDWRAATILASPTLAQYYGGVEKIQNFVKGQMYDDIRNTLGDEIFQTLNEWFFLKDTGGDDKGFRRSHPEIGIYFEIKDKWEPVIAEQTIALGVKLPDTPAPIARENVPVESIGTQDILQGLGQPQAPLIPWEAFQSVLSEGTQSALANQDPTDRSDAELIDLASSLGIPVQQLLQIINQVIPRLQ